MRVLASYLNHANIIGAIPDRQRDGINGFLHQFNDLRFLLRRHARTEWESTSVLSTRSSLTHRQQITV